MIGTFCNVFGKEEEFSPGGGEGVGNISYGWLLLVGLFFFSGGCVSIVFESRSKGGFSG